VRNVTITRTSVGSGSSPLIALAGICCALSLAACGSSSTSRTTVGQSGSLVEFASCMRSHGAPDFPDPGSSGFALVPAGVNAAAPAFKAASSACSHLLPQLHPPQEASAQASEQLLKFSQCMRAHGLTALSDPTPTKPSSHSGYSAVIRRGGAYVAIPATLLASPAYKQATGACRWLLAP
jgi:hypothetical protein